MYSSWYIERDRHNFLSFWAIFCPFTPLATQKIKILKWKKRRGDVIILQESTKNYDHILYCSRDMARDGCSFYFSFWATFCLFTLLTARKIKIIKRWKQRLEILSFYTCVLKIMITWCTVPEIWRATTGGQTDGRTDGKKWHIEVGAHLKKSFAACSV